MHGCLAMLGRREMAIRSARRSANASPVLNAGFDAGAQESDEMEELVATLSEAASEREVVRDSTRRCSSFESSRRRLQ